MQINVRCEKGMNLAPPLSPNKVNDIGILSLRLHLKGTPLLQLILTLANGPFLVDQ